MIGYLSGVIFEKRLREVLMEVGGVGYRIRMGNRDLAKMVVGEKQAVYVHTSVKEDAIDLYGFLERKDMDMFEMLLSVSGIGPKIAVAILGAEAASRIQKAVEDADVSFFQKIPGIGKKGAQRIIVDLKGKMPSLKELDLAETGERLEVVEALVQFGFSRTEVVAVVAELEEELSDEAAIRAGLKRLGKVRS